MKGRKLTNSELDELARGLVKSAGPADSDIEKIVSNPQLFDGVLSRIAEAAADEPVHAVRPRFAWMPVMAAAAVLFAVSISFVAYLRVADKNGNVAVVSQSQETPRFVVTQDLTPQDFTPADEPVEPEPDVPRPTKAVYTKPAPVRAAVEPPKRRTVRPMPQPVTPTEVAFMPIGMTDRAADAALDGRVVRVEVPRAALFAMGVNLPLENGTRDVKADLLVGADGTPKAIRLVE